MRWGELDRRAIEPAPVERSEPAELAWLAALPCAVVVLGAILLLTRPLSHVLYPHVGLKLLPDDLGSLAPKPKEETRYLLALAAPVLLTAGMLLLRRRAPARPRPRLRSMLTLGAQALGLLVVVACFVGHHDRRWTVAYFNVRTLVAAAAIALAILLGASFARTRRDLGSFGESRRTRILLAGLALTAAALWLMPAINNEQSITWSLMDGDVPFQIDETFAVINGLTPLANFHAQYGSLLPYFIGPALVTFGKTVLAYTIIVCSLSVLTFGAIYGVLRRAGRSALAGFLLFVPVLATSLFDPELIPYARFTPGTYFPMFPFRYGDGYLIAWLASRYLDAGRPRRRWLLLLVCGLAIMNNFEFGVPAFAATLAALLATSVAWRPRQLALLARDAAAGLFAALALTAVITLVRAGSLPDLASMVTFARLYAVAGYSVARIPGVFGLPLIIYLTYVAAIGVAVVRALARAENRVLTGMLAWTGIFGLGTASYYVARSDFTLMPITFSAWALALALLTMTAVAHIRARGARRAGLPALAALFGIGLAACSIAQFPYPWTELRRLHTPVPILKRPLEWSPKPAGAPDERFFIAAVVARDGRWTLRRGAPIALFVTTGHRIADAYGVVDVVPFTGPLTMHTYAEYESALDALLAAGGDTVLIPAERVRTLHAPLERRGFRILTSAGIDPAPIRRGRLPASTLVIDGLTKWVDLGAVRNA